MSPTPAPARLPRGSTTGALAARVRVVRPNFSLQADVHIAAGGRLAILGPNGSGKSTLLGAIAGLVPVTTGHITLDGRVLDNRQGASSAAGESGHTVRLRPEQRHLVLLDQKPRLFPHLTVAQNIAFAPRSQGVSRADSRRIADEWLRRLRLSSRGDAMPHQLSGGQQQRIAIARAFAADPALVLLDEPFAALDAESAPLVRALLAEELTTRATSSILVTHDLADAWQLADHCLVLGDGRVVEAAAPRDLASSPQHPFSARLAGFCVVEGRWTGSAVDLGDGILLTAEPSSALAVGDRAFAIIAPQSVTWSGAHDTTAHAAVRTSLRVRLDAVSTRAGVLRVEHRSGLVAEAPWGTQHNDALPRIGEYVHLHVPPVRAHALPSRG